MKRVCEQIDDALATYLLRNGKPPRFVALSSAQMRRLGIDAQPGEVGPAVNVRDGDVYMGLTIIESQEDGPVILDHRPDKFDNMTAEQVLAEARRMRELLTGARAALVRQAGDMRTCPCCSGQFIPKDDTAEAALAMFKKMRGEV